MENENFSSEMEALLDCLGQWILEDEKQPGIISPVRYQQFRLSHDLLQKLITGSDMKIDYEIHEPFNSMGSITIEGDQLEFANCRWLSRAVGFADNLEVYPLATGKIRMVLTFHGMVRKISKPEL